jgi:hypothetical protein
MKLTNCKNGHPRTPENVDKFRRCRECHRIKSKAWLKSHPEQKRKKDRRYQKKHPEYRAYHNAKQRCTNPTSSKWKDYGARGIEFKFNSFKEFVAEVGKRPPEDHSLDRKDNDSHYQKGNVRWAVESQQRENTRKSPVYKALAIYDQMMLLELKLFSEYNLKLSIR